MNRTERALSLGIWTAAQCPFAIEYIPQVLDEIRMAVVAAFHGLAHGGLEVGGILLGSFSAERVTITDFRPLECEHAFGPSFRLSENDHTRLSDVIAEARSAGQTVVGWFHSHTRSGIFLSEADLEIHNRHFSDPLQDPRQVALVLKPIPLKPTLGGFFFREGDGSIHSLESYQEFELEGLSAKDSSARGVPPEGYVHVPNAPAAPQPRQRSRETEELPQTTVQQPVAEPAPLDSHPSREASAAAPRANASQPWQSPKRAKPLRQPAGLQFHWGRVLAGVMVVLAIGAAYVYLSRAEPEVTHKKGLQPPADQALGLQPAGQQPAADQALGLKIQRQGTDLALTWNRNAPDVQSASGGLLSIKDGTKRKEIALNVDQLRSANILFAPESDHVEVQLVVLLPNQRIASESGIAILPGQRSTGPVVLKTTVPSSTYNGAQVKLVAREVKASKPFVAPPTHVRTPDTRPMDQPPVPKPSDSPVRIPASAIASLRTTPGLPPAPPVVEPKRAEAPAPQTAAPASVTGPAAQALPGSSSANTAPTRMPLGGNAQPAELISRTKPIYPYSAHSSHIEGIVVLEGLIGTNGQVKEVKVISGAKVFQKAALYAVSQWVYKPALLNGKTIEARFRVEIHFREGM